MSSAAKTRTAAHWDPRVSLELQTSAEDLIDDTDTEGKCQSEVSVDSQPRHIFFFFFREC